MYTQVYEPRLIKKNLNKGNRLYNFQPITLLNVVVMLLAKILARRLARGVDGLVRQDHVQKSLLYLLYYG